MLANYRVVAVREGVEYGSARIELDVRPLMGETLLTPAPSAGLEPAEWRILEVVHGPSRSDVSLRASLARGDAPAWALDVRYHLQDAEVLRGRRRGVASLLDALDGVHVDAFLLPLGGPFPDMRSAREALAESLVVLEWGGEGRRRLVRRNGHHEPEG